MATSPPTLRDSEAKLQHILRKAAQVFAEQGFQGASIRDISRATQVSLSGLYYYFDSKQQLLYLLQNHAFNNILKQLQERLAQAGTPEEKLQIFIQNHVEYFLAYPAEMKVLSHEEDALEDPFKKEIAGIKRRYYNIAREIFEDLTGRRAAAPLNPRVAVLSLYGMMNWIYKWHNPNVDPGAKELAETMTGIFLRGVLHYANGISGGAAEGAPVERVRMAD